MRALATDLCNNILARGKKEKIDITPVKLQKLMYYTCREYARQTGHMPIEESFEVWKYGPVIPSVYAEFCCYHAEPIKTYSKDARGKSYMADEANNPILRNAIDVVWATMKYLTGVELSSKSHTPGSGWHRALKDCRRIITLEDILNDRS